jgi:hypothetical protein
VQKSYQVECTGKDYKKQGTFFLWEIIPDLVKIATCTKEFVMLWNKSHLLYLCLGGIGITRKKGCVCTLICTKGQYK